MELKLVLILLYILIESVSIVGGALCYNCMSTSQPACGENFKLTSSNTSYIVDSCDICHKYYFKDTGVYIRNCTPKTSHGFHFKSGCEEEKSTGERFEACSCGKDLCNGARSELAALLVVVFICLSVYSLYHLIAFDLHLN